MKTYWTLTAWFFVYCYLSCIEVSLIFPRPFNKSFHGYLWSQWWFKTPIVPAILTKFVGHPPNMMVDTGRSCYYMSWKTGGRSLKGAIRLSTMPKIVILGIWCHFGLNSATFGCFIMCFERVYNHDWFRSIFHAGDLVLWIWDGA